MGDRRSDPWGYFPVDRNRLQKCFECGEMTTGRHHVVPVSLGGTKQIPLCIKCHEKVHQQLSLSGLIKEGLEERKRNGHKLGAPLKLKPGLIKRVIARRNKGQTIRKIAEDLNLSIGSVSNALRSPYV